MQDPGSSLQQKASLSQLLWSAVEYRILNPQGRAGLVRAVLVHGRGGWGAGSGSKFDPCDGWGLKLRAGNTNFAST